MQQNRVVIEVLSGRVERVFASASLQVEVLDLDALVDPVPTAESQALRLIRRAAKGLAEQSVRHVPSIADPTAACSSRGPC